MLCLVQIYVKRPGLAPVYLSSIMDRAHAWVAPLIIIIIIIMIIIIIINFYGASYIKYSKALHNVKRKYN